MKKVSNINVNYAVKLAKELNLYIDAIGGTYTVDSKKSLFLLLCSN